MQESNFKTPKRTSATLAPIIVLSVLLAATIGVLIFIWVRFGNASPQNEGYTPTDTFAMGALVQQTVYAGAGDDPASATGDTEEQQKAVTKAASIAVQDLDHLLSWRSEDSDIAKINNAAGETSVQVDTRTMAVLKTAMDVAQKTDGALDPTILPISILWNFDGDALNEETQSAASQTQEPLTRYVPSKEEIDKFLPDVDYQALQLDEAASTAFLKKKDSGLDLGAIGKGAGCDVAVQAYQDAGMTAGIVTVGGSIGLFGTKPDQSPWVVYIRNPDNKQDRTASMGTLTLSSGFISTSGTYEKTFEKDGVTYHHILDPNTGYPAQSDLVSVTVVCDNGALSDALSTACLILGKEKSQTLLDQYNANAVFVDKENNVSVTDGLKDALSVTALGFTLVS